MIARAERMMPPTEFVRLHEPAAKLDGVIALHSTARGPAAGGCRFWHYDTSEAAMEDAFRLAEGMSYKNAMARLPLGGGKAVIRKPQGDFDRRALFEAFGEAVERLDGRYVTAEDVGTGVTDMEVVATKTDHVAGRTARPGFAGGDPSPWTALGVFEAMKATARAAFDAPLQGMTVSVLGVGSVGGELCRLLAGEGARLIIADINEARCRELADACDARIVGLDAIVGMDAEIFAPCALGGALDAATVSALKARAVCGAANNQLAADGIAEAMLLRGITYAPDYVVNAGGIINVAAEYLKENESEVRARVMQIGPRTAEILEQAAADKLSPALIADQMAEALISPEKVDG